MRIDPIDPEAADAAELDDWHDFCRRTDLFDLPEDPAPPRAVTVGELFDHSDRRVTWFARSDGELVGGGTLTLTRHENPHFAEFHARVRPDLRRTGIGRALFDRARNTAVTEGRTSMTVWVQTDSPGAGFAEAMGFRPALTEIRRVLRTVDVDPGAVAGWAGGAAARSDGFDLVCWVDHCPEDLLEPYAKAKEGMNDAPMGEVDWHPVTLTGERVRTAEDASIRSGWRRYAMVVRERSSGTVAGMTDVFVSPDSPRANQGETTVLGSYRGRGFGLWLKAAMVRWLTDVEPSVTEYETYNAAENRYMIAVNERLGYRQVDAWQAWKLTIG
ncbi:MAG TPA: GNAT family N-acetyltransferase [Mycobacteriales bacterium]|jgi:Acetyltransferase (GNAT) family.